MYILEVNNQALKFDTFSDLQAILATYRKGTRYVVVKGNKVVTKGIKLS